MEIEVLVLMLTWLHVEDSGGLAMGDEKRHLVTEVLKTGDETLTSTREVASEEQRTDDVTMISMREVASEGQATTEKYGTAGGNTGRRKLLFLEVRM